MGKLSALSSYSFLVQLRTRSPKYR
jgi:hypothetical protein